MSRLDPARNDASQTSTLSDLINLISLPRISVRAVWAYCLFLVTSYRDVAYLAIGAMEVELKKMTAVKDFLV